MTINVRTSALNIPLEVRSRISSASGVSATLLQDSHKLVQDLRLSHPACANLSQSLDSFVRTHNPRGKILLTDVENGEATVSTTVTLVAEEIAGR